MRIPNLVTGVTARLPSDDDYAEAYIRAVEAL